MQRGEVWEIDLPSPPGGAGREQSGRRPALVIQAAFDPANPMSIIAPFTSNQSAARFPNTITIAPSSANGLTTVSILMLFQLRALDSKRFIRRLGGLTSAELAAVDGLLRPLLGLT